MRRNNLYKKKYRYKGKLIYEYLIMLAAVFAILVVSFLCTSYIAKHYAIEESRQSADVIFEQATDRIRIFEEDINSLYMNVVYNPSVRDLMSAPDFSERWKTMDSFLQMVGNNMRINQCLKNVSLYDMNGKLIANRGEVFFPWKGEFFSGTKAVYSDIIISQKTGEKFFQVGMTIYEEKDGNGFYPAGFVCLLFHTGNLQEIVDGALLNDESGVMILDSSENVVVSAGLRKNGYRKETDTREDENNLIYVSPVGNTGWKLISVIPLSSMTDGLKRMQSVNHATYLSVLFIMILVCALVYRRIIRPISYQTAFMSSFTEDTGRRLVVTQNNEIGELANKMNQMLDDIEALNKRIIDSSKKLLELEYAKKQTEMIAYRSQMNPHFLSNTFNCIRGMALYHDEKEIAELTLSLSSFFRYCIQKEDFVTIQEVLDNLQHYAKIIQYRFNGKHQITVEASRKIFQMKIPKLLIQPLVENSVLHGLELKMEGGKVNVNITLEEQGNTLKNGTYGIFLRKLIITVEDDGEGISEDIYAYLRDSMKQYDKEGTIPDRKDGIGVLNVYRRLRLFYGKDAEFEIADRFGGGTCVRLAFPIKTEGSMGKGSDNLCVHET